MGVCCTKEQTQMNELINSFNYSNDEIISNSKIDSILVSELRLETVKTTKTQEEKELELIMGPESNHATAVSVCTTPSGPKRRLKR